MVFLDTPVEITPGSTGWQDVDISDYVPAGATGVVLHWHNSTANGYVSGWRCEGSGDNRTQQIYGGLNAHFWVAIGISNQIVEINVGNTTNLNVWLVAYYTTDAGWLTNGQDVTPAGNGAWTDKNIGSYSGDDTPLGAIIEYICSTGGFGLRNDTSTDDRREQQYQHGGGVIGCTSEICEIYKLNGGDYLYLNGWLKADCSFYVNGADRCPASQGDWYDLSSALPADAIGGYFDCWDWTYWQNYGIRKKGSSEDIYGAYGNHPWAIVQCDADKKIQAKLQSTLDHVFLVGYQKETVLPVNVQVSDTLYL